MYGSPCDLQSADESAFTKPIVHNTRKSFASKFLIITKMRRSKRAVKTPLRFREDASSTSSSASEDGRKEKKKGQKAEKPGPGPSKKTTKKAKTKPSVTLVVKKRRTSSPGKGTAVSSKGQTKTSEAKPKKVGRSKGLTRDEIQAVRENVEERERQLEELVNSMTVQELCRFLIKLGKEQPGVVLDLMDLRSKLSRPPAVPPTNGQALHWCVCTNCREMPTGLEEVCCRQAPTSCISRTPDMQLLCIDAHVLHISILYRADVLAAQNIQGASLREKNKSYRFAGYRQFVLWQHGRLGAGVRRVIPSCCVWRIRDAYHDPSGQYVPFRPGMNM